MTDSVEIPPVDRISNYWAPMRSRRCFRMMQSLPTNTTMARMPQAKSVRTIRDLRQSTTNRANPGLRQPTALSDARNGE